MKRLSAGLFLVLLATSCSDDDAVTTTQITPRVTTSPTTSEASTTTMTTSATTASVPTVLEVDLDADILVHVAAGLGSVWATGASGPIPYLYKIDPDTGAVDASWELESEPEPGTLSLGVGHAYVWVVLRSTVARVDPQTGTWDAIDFGKGPVEGTWLEYPWAVNAGEEAAWVVVVEQGDDFEDSHHLYKIDPRFRSPVDAIVGHVELGADWISELLVADGRVWLLYDGDDDTCGLLAVDSLSMDVTDRIELSGWCDLGIASLAAGGGYVYAASRGGRNRWVDIDANAETSWTEADSNGLVAYSGETLWEGAHGRDYGLGAIVGYGGGGMTPTSETVYGLLASDLATTNDALWLLVDEPPGLLRLVPDYLEGATAAPTTTEAPTGTGAALVWTFSGEGVAALPVLGDGIAYTQDTAATTALDLDTGEVIWSTALPTADPETPVLSGGTLMALSVPEYFEDASGWHPGGVTEVVGFDAGDGTELWRTQVEALVNVFPPAIDEDVLVIVGTGDLLWDACGDLCYPDGWVMAFDAQTGHELWGFAAHSPRAVGVGDGTVVVPFIHSTLTAYDLATGVQMWSTSNCTGILGRPVITNGRIVVANLPAAVPYGPCRQAFDLSTGAELWSVEIEDYGEGLLVLTDDIAYVGDAAGMSAIDAATGEELWRVDGLAGQPTMVGQQLVVDGVDADGNRIMVGVRSADGVEIWRLDVTGENTPWWWRVVAGEGIVVRTDGETLQAFAVSN